MSNIGNTLGKFLFQSNPWEAIAWEYLSGGAGAVSVTIVPQTCWAIVTLANSNAENAFYSSADVESPDLVLSWKDTIDDSVAGVLAIIPIQEFDGGDVSSEENWLTVEDEAGTKGGYFFS